MTGPPPFAWIAGVVDARAHITVHDRDGHPAPRLRVTTRHLPLLAALSRFTGTEVRTDDRGYTRRPCGDHCNDRHQHVVRQSASWTADSGRATVILYNVLPLMIAQRDTATACLEAGLRRYPPARGNIGTQMAALGWPLPSENTG